MHFLRRVILYVGALLMTMGLSACVVGITPPDASAPKPIETEAAFVARLQQALTQQDFAQLQSMMSDPFVMGGWRAEGRELPAAVAIVQLRNRYFSEGRSLTFSADQDLSALLDGVDPLALVEPSVHAVQALYITGLGQSQQDEALLLIAQAPGQAPTWSAILVAAGGFQAQTAMAEQFTMTDPTAVDATVAVTPTTPTAALTPLVADAITHTATITDAATIIDLIAITGSVAITPVLVSGPPSIQFTPGADTAIVRGVAQPPATNSYLLHVAAHQVVTINLASPEGVANFVLTGLNDGQAYKELADEAHLWSERLPLAQDYQIDVTAAKATAFEMTVTIADSADDPVSPIAAEQVAAGQ
ncbi:MAG: hypothetical protein R3C14_39415 [Caldilineaceae bacterium]